VKGTGLCLDYNFKLKKDKSSTIKLFVSLGVFYMIKDDFNENMRKQEVKSINENGWATLYHE